MPHPILDGVSKNDLLKLKHSKPVPIIAHSSEVVVPVVYATRVKEFMKKEGMKVPLAPEELKTLKQVARKMDGTPEPYAKGGTIKIKKVRAKKIKINKDVVKKGNIKQVVNIKLGEKAKIIRRPSARAKAIGKENIPIRPGVSTYPMSTEPSYSRMIPSTGATTNIPLPTTASNIPSAQPLAKPEAMPTTVKPSTLDVLKRADIGRQAALVGERRIQAQQQAADAVPRRYTGLTEQVGNQPGRKRPVVAPTKK